MSAQVKSNLSIIVRERGKIVTRREGHNIWLNVGRTYLSRLISLASFGPSVPEDNRLPQYIGFGIGGAKQDSLTVANNPPLSTHYPGPGHNNNLDTDPTISVLERPVRISWAAGPSTPTGSYGSYSYPIGDVWLKQLNLPYHPTVYSTKFTASFFTGDFSTAPFTSVPLSEIGLFLSDANINVYNNQTIAMDTFPSISKTNLFSMDVSWEIRF